MLKTITAVALASGLFAGAANAQSNPLQPNYPTFAAAIDFGNAQGSVTVAKNPLTPSYFEWNASAVADSRVVEIVANNPLQPGYKRS